MKPQIKKFVLIVTFLVLLTATIAITSNILKKSDSSKMVADTTQEPIQNTPEPTPTANAVETNTPKPSVFSTLSVTGTLYSTKESTLELPETFQSQEIVGISLVDENDKILAADYKFKDNQLYLTPSKDLVGEKTYRLRFFTKDKRKYQSELTAADYIKIDSNKNSYIKVSAKPDKGYNYPYYLLIPEGTQSNAGKKYLVVEPNNTGYPSDYLEFHEIAVKVHLHDYGIITGGAGGYQVATGLNTPLLIPVFPRPNSEDGTGVYVHALDRETMLARDVDYERPDLQLIAMIEDAQELLAKYGIELEKKVFLVGFSASGDFVNRFMFLHPEMVKAVASSSSTIFPASEYEGIKLNYPLGIADMESLFGIKFNAEEFKSIAKYIYRGDQDGNDYTNDNDNNGEEYVSAIRKLFKDETQPYKWNRKIEIMDNLGYNEHYQYHTYKEIGDLYGLSPGATRNRIMRFRQKRLCS